jgi:hypothetical protein
MSISIEESGMSFGPFSEDNVFAIESSPLFTNLGKGLKIAEFVLLRDFTNRPQEAWVVEAKSSAPKEHTDYVDEIRQKFTNSIQLTFASCLKRHRNATELLPPGFLNLDLENCPIKCILVVRNFPKAWLDPLQKALIKEMNSLVKTMGLKPGSVVVINDEMARGRNLIT